MVYRLRVRWRKAASWWENRGPCSRQCVHGFLASTQTEFIWYYGDVVSRPSPLTRLPKGVLQARRRSGEVPNDRPTAFCRTTDKKHARRRPTRATKKQDTPLAALSSPFMKIRRTKSLTSRVRAGGTTSSTFLHLQPLVWLIRETSSSTLKCQRPSTSVVHRYDSLCSI